MLMSKGKNVQVKNILNYCADLREKGKKKKTTYTLEYINCAPKRKLSLDGQKNVW